MRSPTLPTTGTATVIRNGETRLVRQAEVSGLASAPTQFESVYRPPTAMLTARCLRNFLTDMIHPRGKVTPQPVMSVALRRNNAKVFRFLRLSKAFGFAINSRCHAGWSGDRASVQVLMMNRSPPGRDQLPGKCRGADGQRITVDWFGVRHRRHCLGRDGLLSWPFASPECLRASCARQGR